MIEGLGRSIKSRVDLGLIQGWRWSNNFPFQSHLQFVDDTTMMGLARVDEAVNLRKALDFYLATSRKIINEIKSSIYFFNTPKLIQ